MAAHQQLEHVVERRGVRGVGLDDRLQVLDRPAEAVMLEPRLVALHPVDVAQERVDLAVVRQHAERLGQLPLREGVGRIALMEDREARGEALVQQVGIEGRQMLGQEHALVDDRAAGERADVELGDVLGQRRLLHAPAQDVELLLELAVVEPGVAAADQDLLDLGPRGVGLLADHRDVDRHLAPAQDGVAEAQDLGLDDGAAALLRAEVGARQEHHADGDAARPAGSRRSNRAHGRGRSPAGSRHGCRRRRRSCRRHRRRRDATPPSAHRCRPPPRRGGACRPAPRPGRRRRSRSPGRGCSRRRR